MMMGPAQLALALFLGCLAAGTTVFADKPQPATDQSIPPSEVPVQAFQAKSFDGLPYRLLVPPQADQAEHPGKAYPLVLFLHGAGERGDDNERQLKHVASEFLRPDRRDKHPAYVIFPQCPAEQRWVETPWDLKSGSGQFPAEPSDPMAKVLALVDSMIAELPIDPARVYVTGLSMGGQGTWFASAQKPQRFAAMVQVCGGGDPTWATQYAGLPIWVFHGQTDPVVPVLRAREMISALATVGHHPELRLTEYPGVGHDSWTRTYAQDEVFDWLFSKSKP